MPGAGVHWTGQVAGGGVGVADREAGTEPAGPAAEAGPLPQRCAALVEDPDVQRVTGHTGRDRGPVVAVADVDLRHSGRHLDRHIHKVRHANVEMPADGLCMCAASGSAGEPHRRQRHGACRSGHGRGRKEPAAR